MNTMFKKMITLCLLLSCKLTLASALSDFEEGKQYVTFSQSVMEEESIQAHINELKPGEIKVLEFFSYGCVWCYRLDAKINDWLVKKSENIQFERVPVIFQPSWKDLTKAYYAAEDLKILDKVHQPLFKAIHDDGMVATTENIKAAFESQGISGPEFEAAFSSSSIDNHLKQAEGLAHVFKIRRIPSVAILTPNGGYFATVSMAGSEDKLIELIEAFSVEKSQEVKEEASVD